MKKIVLLSLLVIVFTSILFAGNPRVMTQQIALENGDIFDYVTNMGQTHSENYILRVTNVESGEMKATDLPGHIVSGLKVVKLSEAVAALMVNQSIWDINWAIGSTLHIQLWFTGATTNPSNQAPYPHYEYAEMNRIVPAGSGAMTYVMGDNAWIIPPFPSGVDYTLGVRSNWAGAAIYLDGVTTGQVTPYTFDPAAAGTYTVVMPSITWTPASFTYAAEADETVTFMGEFTPGVAVNPIPVDGSTLTWADGVTDTVVLSWDPVTDASYYNVYWNGATAPVQATEPTFTTPVIGDGAYTWQIVPYVTDPAAPAKGVRKASPLAAKVSGSSSIRGGAINAPVWGFTIEYAPPVYTLTITSDPVGAAVLVGGVAVSPAAVTPYNTTVAGTYSLATMTGYEPFVPAEYIWDGAADHTENFVADPIVVGPFDLTLTSTPTGATIFIDGVKQLDGANDLVTPHTFVAAAAGVYEVRLVRQAFAPETYTYAATADETVNFVGTAIPVEIEPNETLSYVGLIPGGTPRYPNAIPLLTTVNLTGDEFLFHGANYLHATAFASVPVALLNLNPGPPPEYFTIDREDRYEMVGDNSDATVYITTNAPIFMYHTGDFEWVMYLGPIDNDPYTFPLELTRGYTIFEWKTGWIDEETVPVELSSFTAAQPTGQRFVELTWISATETNMLGYRVYRNETQEASTATLISALYDATNTSSTAVYKHTDMNVSAGNTYYYWLEAVDYNHSTMFGPQYVEVTAEPVAPELITQTTMSSAYPNPFKANTSTSIDVSVKTGETGTVTIYNVLGQVVKTVNVTGVHTVNWNGRDSKGNACGSGIYFYKLSTPSMNQTKKMVIVK